MLQFVVKRTILNIAVILAVILISFLIMHSVPGGPFDREKKLPELVKANVEKKFKLDLPLEQQFINYVEGICYGDFGPSYKYTGRSVSDIIGDAFPVSAMLGMVSFLFCLLLGFAGGIISALRADKSADYFVQFASICGISLPSFVLSALLISVFSIMLGIFPPALWEGARYIILPSIALAMGPAAYLARLLRGSILDTFNANFVSSAKAKGLSRQRIFIKHVLFNSLIPVVTVLGPLFAALVTGSFVVEHIFSIPGMGKFFVLAVTDRDYPMIMGITIVYSVILVLANFAVDISYAFLDPRIRNDRDA